jgi:hypothetical protein
LTPSLDASPPRETLVGSVDRVTFHNDDNGFAVLKVKARGKRDRVRGGPHDGRWFWAVQIGPGRVPFNSGGAGNADGGREAREPCEAILRAMRDS